MGNGGTKNKNNDGHDSKKQQIVTSLLIFLAECYVYNVFGYIVIIIIVRMALCFKLKLIKVSVETM